MRIIKFNRSFQIFVLILLFVLGLGLFWGIKRHQVTVSADTLRTITTLGPAEVTVGDPSFTVLVNGTGFTTGDTVLLSGSPLITTFVSDTLLTAFVPANALQIAASLGVSVLPAGANTQPQGQATLTVTTPSTVIAISSIAPQNVTLNQANISLVITGVGFDKNCTVFVAGVAQPTPTVATVSGGTTLTVTLNASATATQGFLAVQVFNSTLQLQDQLRKYADSERRCRDH